MLCLALVCFALLVYTYVGYPIVIAILARLFPTRSAALAAAHEPSVSVIIPVFNASSYVEAKLRSLLDQDYPAEKLQILICSDGSTDDSIAKIRAIAQHDPRVVVMELPKRSGKPTAVNAMKAQASGDVLVLTDIRQPLSKNAIRALVEALADPKIACATGNLQLVGATGAGFYWKYENWIRQNEGTFRSMVGVTGPLYAIAKADLADLPTDIILDDMWVPMKLRLRGRRIVFVTSAIAQDDAFADEREFGRKVRTLAGNYQLFSKMPQLLIPLVNPSWFEVFSHKILRLVCPWLLVLLAISSLAALCCLDKAGSWQKAAVYFLLAGQAAFYGFGALGGAAGGLGRICRTFLVLNAAAALGLWRFMRNSQKVTW